LFFLKNLPGLYQAGKGSGRALGTKSLLVQDIVAAHYLRWLVLGQQ
jgi:hypothetical protein